MEERWITSDIAKDFLEDPKKGKLNGFVGIEDEAAEILAQTDETLYLFDIRQMSTKAAALLANGKPMVIMSYPDLPPEINEVFNSVEAEEEDLFPTGEDMSEEDAWNLGLRDWNEESSHPFANQSTAKKIGRTFSLVGHEGYSSCGCFHHDRFFSGGEDGEIRLWCLKSRKLIASLSAHAGTISMIRYNPINGLLYSSGWDGFIRIWNESGEMVREFDHRPNAISFSKTGSGWQVQKPDREMGVVNDFSFISEASEILYCDRTCVYLADSELNYLGRISSPGASLYVRLLPNRNSYAVVKSGLRAGGVDFFRQDKKQRFAHVHRLNPSCISFVEEEDSLAVSHNFDLMDQRNGGWISLLDLSEQVEYEGPSVDDSPVSFDTGYMWKAHDVACSTVSSVSDFMLLSTGYDGTVKLWDIHEEWLHQVFETSHSEVYDSIASPSEHGLVAAVGDSGKIDFFPWDV